MVLVSSFAEKHQFSLHFLPAIPHFRRASNRITWSIGSSIPTPPVPTSHVHTTPMYESQEATRDREICEAHRRQGSYASTTSSSSAHSTIYQRRRMSHQNTARSPPTLPMEGLSDFFHARPAAIAVPHGLESDAECWERMLMLQREYHCYKSARLEAAVEALEAGTPVEMMPIRTYH